MQRLFRAQCFYDPGNGCQSACGIGAEGNMSVQRTNGGTFLDQAHLDKSFAYAGEL
jgi:hypothetical protein